MDENPDLDPLVDDLWGMNHLIVAAVYTFVIPYWIVLVMLHFNTNWPGYFVQGTKGLWLWHLTRAARCKLYLWYVAQHTDAVTK